jgi:hypothetical protein
MRDFLSPIGHPCNTLGPGTASEAEEGGVTRMVVVALMVTLAGCGFHHWHKDGADDAAFQRDSADCQQPNAGAFDACMTGKGWAYDTRL